MIKSQSFFKFCIFIDSIENQDAIDTIKKFKYFKKHRRAGGVSLWTYCTFKQAVEAETFVP